MAIRDCANCGAKNRVDERAEAEGRRPVCGRCGTQLGVDMSGGETAGEGGDTFETHRPLAVTDETFAREVEGASATLPVLLDCWAAWCGPCRTIAPVLDQMASESRGRYLIAKLNVDENPRTAAQLGVQSIPTLFIYKGGQQVECIVGAQPKHVLAARLAAHF
ncbi:MAG: thioredoxin [Acidobacteria bacterium]|nr:thioredoxin [Acidobacteriota bacterium]